HGSLGPNHLVASVQHSLGAHQVHHLGVDVFVEVGAGHLADRSFGSGVAILRFWLARMLVSRNTSARDHSFITSSSDAASLRSSGSVAHVDVNAWIVPEPFAGIVPPIDTRSFISVVSETRHPSPGLPSISEFGMCTFVKNTSLNSASPVICRSGSTSTPGACMSTTNAVRPACF